MLGVIFEEDLLVSVKDRDSGDKVNSNEDFVALLLLEEKLDSVERNFSKEIHILTYNVHLF